DDAEGGLSTVEATLADPLLLSLLLNELRGVPLSRLHPITQELFGLALGGSLTRLLRSISKLHPLLCKQHAPVVLINLEIPLEHPEPNPLALGVRLVVADLSLHELEDGVASSAAVGCNLLTLHQLLAVMD